MTRPARHEDDSVTPDVVPSLGVVEEALLREEESYRFRAGGLDTRLGLLLGAAGVLVALTGQEPSIAGIVRASPLEPSATGTSRLIRSGPG